MPRNHDISELKRLDWKEVRIAAGKVVVRASKAKSARSRSVVISENLKAWLTPHAKTSGPVWPENGRKRLEAARRAAGFGAPKEVEKSIEVNKEDPEKPILREWPENGMRHSFATYHLLHHKDAGALALEMGHKDCSIIFKHYRNVDATDQEAATFWSISPEVAANVVTMAKAG